LSLNIHLPSSGDYMNLTCEQVQAWLDDDELCFVALEENDSAKQEKQEEQPAQEQQQRQHYDIRVTYVDEQAFVNPTTGRRTRTFRFTYPRGMTKKDAKTLHIGLCHQVPKVFPGVEVRQLPN
jgi:hypothetical protein